MLPLVLLLAAAPAAAQDLSLSGTGLLTLPGASTLDRGRAALAITVDNRDRDPLGLDLLDGAVAGAVGLADGLEAYGRAVLSRVVSLPEPPPLPPPPLDLVVLAPDPVPGRPLYALFAPTPYVNKRGTARFDDWVKGDLLLGLKRRLWAARGARPAAALAAEATLPLTRSPQSLRSGAGTGGVDLGAAALLEWGDRRRGLIAVARYTRTGSPAQHDRVLLVADGRVQVREERLALADRLELGLGVRHSLGARLSALAEGTVALDVGGRTPVLDARTPVDALLGLQLRLGHVRLSAGLRYHGHALPDGDRRPSPLAGFVDLSGVAKEALASYLESIGAQPAAPLLRTGVQTVLAAAPRGPLPEGARVIPADYLTRSEHQVGYVALLGWAF